MITGREIGERFIRAVQIAEKLYHVSNSPSGRAAWPLYNYTQSDKNGWGTERLAAERRAFWNSINHAPKRWEISQAEETQSWLRFVDKEDERLCLVSWARCMASNEFFQDWCRSAGISRETGRRRKERAIVRILVGLDCKVLQHNEIDVSDLLPDPPEIGHIDVNIAEGVTNWTSPKNSTMACDFDTALDNFDWARKQNERRRQREKKREAKRRQEQEAA
jgi:hypothetical protein